VEVLERGDAGTRVELEAGELGNPLLASLAVDLTDGVSPAEAAVLAAANNPDLVAARDARGEAAAELLAAGLLPNPTLGAEALEPYGAGSGGLQLARTLQLSVDSSSLVTRGARVEAARAATREVDLGIAWQEWLVAGSARLAALRLGWLRERSARIGREVGFLEESVAALRRAQAAGDETTSALGIELAALESTRQARRDLEGAEATTESQLRAALGLAPMGRIEVEAARAPGDAELETPALEDLLDDCLAHRLDLAALRHGYQAEQARLRQAVLEQLPAITVGIAHERNEDAVRFLGGFLELGLPVFDRSQAKVALAEATRARLGHEYEARVFAVRQQLDELLRSQRTLASQIREVRDALPLAQGLEQRSREALARGDLERLAYQAIRSNRFDLEQTLASLFQAHAEAGVGVALACGRSPEREAREPRA
jgi:outer membrane protein TolC